MSGAITTFVKTVLTTEGDEKVVRAFKNVGTASDKIRKQVVEDQKLQAAATKKTETHQKPPKYGFRWHCATFNFLALNRQL